MGAHAPRTPRGAALAIALTVVAGVASATPAAAVTGPLRVIAGPEDQLLPAANATYVIWTQNSEARPNRYHAYGKVRGTTDVFRLNEPGTRGYSGGLDPDQDRAIYQQIEGRNSDLFTIDLTNPTSRVRLGPTINTARWEWGPRISNAYVLFARDGSLKTSIFLYDRAARTAVRLVSRDIATTYLAPGAVGERYATWSACSPTDCNAFVHDTETGTTRRVPAPPGKGQYAPLVHEGDAQLFFARSGPSCGANVRIMRVPVATLAATPVRLTTLPSGIDVGYQMASEDVGGLVDLWFSRYRCAPRQGDIFRLRDVGTH
jgi:hypothetical protein